MFDVDLLSSVLTKSDKSLKISLASLPLTVMSVSYPS